MVSGWALATSLLVSGCSDLGRGAACDSAWEQLDEDTAMLAFGYGDLTTESPASEYQAVASELRSAAEAISAISARDTELAEVLEDIASSLNYISDFWNQGPHDFDTISISVLQEFEYDSDKLSHDAEKLVDLCGPPDWAEE